MKLNRLSTLLLLPLLCLSKVLAEEPDPPKSPTDAGFIDLNHYYDTRGFTTMTVNLLASLSSNFEYFSLTDYSGQRGTRPRSETDGYYTEQNLRWPVKEGLPLSISTQAVGQSGDRNDLVRAGILVRLSEIKPFRRVLDGSKNSFSINLFPAQLDHLDGFNWQMEYFYRFQILPSLFSDRLYLSGFADQNLNREARSTWVTQHQLGMRAVGGLYAIAEARYNGFLPSDRRGAGLGLQYLINW